MPDLWADSLPEHRKLVRGRLLAAFAELAAQMPVDDITLTAVAERAGIARSAVYNYVASKHDLLVEYTVDVTAAWSDRMAHTQRRPVAERLEQFVAETLRVFAEDPLAGAEDTSWSEGDHERIVAALQPVREHLVALLAEGVDSGAFAGEPADLAAFVFATLAGYRTAIIRGETTPERAAAIVSRLLLDGLRGPATH